MDRRLYWRPRLLCRRLVGRSDFSRLVARQDARIVGGDSFCPWRCALTKTLTVLLPFYNERDTVADAVERLLKTQLPVPLEVILIDDDSTDGSAESLARFVDEGRATLVRQPVNKGKGAAIRRGLGLASGQMVTVLDADLEYDPSDYKDLLLPLLDGEAEVVYGSRSFTSNTAFSFWYVLGNRFLAFACSFLYNTWLSDIETCLKMAPIDVWKGMPLRSNGFGIEAEFTAKVLRSGRKIYEVPISYSARTREEGKKLHWTDGIVALGILLAVRLMPRRRLARSRR